MNKDVGNKETTMPHVIVKLWPGKSEQQKTRLAEAITKDVMDILHYGEESVLVAMEEVKSQDCAQPDHRVPYYFNLALDNGVKPREISEIITHLAFYSGWANAMSAVAATKNVFAERKIGADQLPPASPTLLPLDKDAEAKRVAGVEQQFGHVAPDLAVHHGRSVPRFVAASGPCASRSESGHGQRTDRFRPGRADSVSPQQGDG
jgi:phenylpyruvate tautomerase PptA (4-oxalocrotonate tautomerase family)